MKISLNDMVSDEPPLLDGAILKACRRDLSFALETAGGGRNAGRGEIGWFELILIIFPPILNLYKRVKPLSVLRSILMLDKKKLSTK